VSLDNRKEPCKRSGDGSSYCQAELLMQPYPRLALKLGAESGWVQAMGTRGTYAMHV
jgi:hypothetical protein